MKYFEYLRELEDGPIAVPTNEHPVYTKRKFRTKQIYGKRFQEHLDRAYQQVTRVEQRMLLDSFGATLTAQQTDNQRNYGLLYNTIQIDELAYLELANLSEYKKTYNYLVDLSECLDVVLAFMIGCDLGEIQFGINELCKHYEIDPVMLSRAWITGERQLLLKSRLELIYGIHTGIKEKCLKEINSANIGGLLRFKGVPVSNLDSQTLLQMSIRSQILIDIQYMLLQVVEQYGEQKIDLGECILVSKGSGHILIQSDIPHRDLKFNITLPGLGTFEITALEYGCYEYPEVLIGGTRRLNQIA